MTISKSVQELSDLIAFKAKNEAEYYPVDRSFLNSYLEDILNADHLQFIVYNFENANNTYTVQLMACLPEIWETVCVDELIRLLNSFTNVFSFYGLILFTYKYIEIDIIPLLLSLPTISIKTKDDIKKYLLSQYPNLLKQENDFFLFDEGVMGGDSQIFQYLKQRFLLDDRIGAAKLNLAELENYVNSL